MREWRTAAGSGTGEWRSLHVCVGTCLDCYYWKMRERSCSAMFRYLFALRPNEAVWYLPVCSLKSSCLYSAYNSVLLHLGWLELFLLFMLGAIRIMCLSRDDVPP